MFNFFDRIKNSIKRFDRSRQAGIIIESLPSDYKIIEEYWVYEPFAKIAIVMESSDQLKYYALEEQLTPEEEELYERLLSFMESELDPPDDGVNREKYIISEAEAIINRYKRLKPKSKRSQHKILYCILRELAGFSYIHPLMLDPNIEDISCNGIGLPLYVYHRRYESLPTNIIFIEESALDDFVIKLAHMSGKHISTAHPILDATLPGKHRLAATFMREVSNMGSSFCIRKFRERPLSIIDLIIMGTINEELAAYFWILVENKMSVMILGGTGAGKTTTLNALLSLIKPETKIVSVEETAEINISHKNWVPLIAREEFGVTGAQAKAITLFDLVKTSLRYRPDYLIVGEIRGEEAYVLFQALATGHGGMSTMHADSLDYAIKRLTSPPMNISKIYLPLMNAWIHIERVSAVYETNIKSVRRIKSVWELNDNLNHRIIAEWVPNCDCFRVDLKDSFLLKRIAYKNRIDFDKLLLELKIRADYLRSLKDRGVTSYKEVTEAIRAYYRRRQLVLADIRNHQGDLYGV